MNMRRSVFLAVLLAGSIGVAGCGKNDESGTPSEVANDAAPDAKPGIAASGGRLILPVVPGRPGVAYFSLSNSSKSDVAIAGIHIEGVGKAEMHKTSGGSMAPVENLTVKSGGSATFAPGGLHIMAFDIDGKLKPGSATELTVTFADRDKLSLPLKVVAMGAGDDGMAGMHH